MSRNAIKYQPFQAVEGHSLEIKNLNEEKNNISKPLLSVDDEERINRDLCYLLENDSFARFTFFKNNRLITIESKIKKINSTELILIDQIINLADLINIEVI